MSIVFTHEHNIGHNLKAIDHTSIANILEKIKSILATGLLPMTYSLWNTAINAVYIVLDTVYQFFLPTNVLQNSQVIQWHRKWTLV